MDLQNLMYYEMLSHTLISWDCHTIILVTSTNKSNRSFAVTDSTKCKRS